MIAARTVGQFSAHCEWGCDELTDGWLNMDSLKVVVLTIVLPIQVGETAVLSKSAMKSFFEQIRKMQTNLQLECL